MQSRSSSVDGTDRVHGKKTMGNGKDRTKGEVGLSTYLETLRKVSLNIFVNLSSRVVRNSDCVECGISKMRFF